MSSATKKEKKKKTKVAEEPIEDEAPYETLNAKPKKEKKKKHKKDVDAEVYANTPEAELAMQESQEKSEKKNKKKKRKSSQELTDEHQEATYNESPAEILKSKELVKIAKESIKKHGNGVSVAGLQSASASSPFENVVFVSRVSLPPAYIQNVKMGIESHLNSFVMKYREELGGVLLTYSDVQLKRNYGHILYENPYINFAVTLQALVFRPQKGMILNGVVNKVGSNHIGMLVHGVFNASIAAHEVTDGFVFNPHKDAWTDENGSTIAVGDNVSFRVLMIHESTGIISIAGTLRPETKQKRKTSLSVDEVPTKKTKKARS